MLTLTLKAGGTLHLIRPERDDEDRLRPAHHDVTAVAQRFLFDEVAVEEGVTLRDVFRLLEEAPVLQDVFSRFWAAAYLAEIVRIERGCAPPDETSPEPADPPVEYLGLKVNCRLNSDTGELHLDANCADLSGMSVQLEQDLPEYGRKAGERVSYSVSLTPIGELLHLPIRVCPSMEVQEDDLDSRQWGKPLRVVPAPTLTLGQLLNGLLGDLSFHGGPDGAREAAQDLASRMDEVRSGAVKTIDAYELFGSAEDALTDLIADAGPHEVEAILDTIRDLGDGANAAEGLRQALSDSIVVKPAFVGHTGRQFRAALRQARDARSTFHQRMRERFAKGGPDEQTS